MFKLSTIQYYSKEEMYGVLLEQAKALTAGESDFIANCANIASLIFHSLPELNWAGFYFYKDGDLVLGPFQGKPSCVRLKPGRGVCWAAADSGKTVIVPDVHKFPGHIACSSESNAEIVIPLIKDGRLLGVLDLDSPVFDRFDKEDKKGLEGIWEIVCGLSLS